MKLNSEELRAGTPTKEQLEHLKKNKNEIYIVLDDVLDTYNIGAIFRLADAVAAKKVLLCKGSETPPNSRIQKASVNTWQWVDWEYFETTEDAVDSLRKTVPRIRIVGVELSEKSISYTDDDYKFPVALVVGHETDGISDKVLALCDSIVELPMCGINTSLNVMVSLGIVLYEVLDKNNIVVK
jgi:23S rRNA (guanosine2251-2'-O)-methyltransferase